MVFEGATEAFVAEVPVTDHRQEELRDAFIDVETAFVEGLFDFAVLENGECAGGIVFKRPLELEKQGVGDVETPAIGIVDNDAGPGGPCHFR